jgi:Histidine kinase-like ATPase domain
MEPAAAAVPVAAVLTAVRAPRDFRGQQTPPASPAAQPGPASPAAQPGPASPEPYTGRLCLSDEIDQPAMAAQWPDTTDSTGCHWLMLAAQIAGVVNDSWLSPPHPARTGRERPPRIAMCALTPQARSACTARDFTFATLRRWGTGYNGQDIAIVVSELVTNALRHAVPQPGAASPPWRARLGLLQYKPWLLCAVADPSKTPPAPRPPGSLAETGRGLQMICALSDRWGYTKPNDAGKIVWAMFTAGHAPPSRPGTRQARPPPNTETARRRPGPAPFQPVRTAHPSCNPWLAGNP